MVNQYCAHSFARNWQLPFLKQQKGEDGRRKYFMINLHDRMLPIQWGSNPQPPDHQSYVHPTEPARPAMYIFWSVQEYLLCRHVSSCSGWTFRVWMHFLSKYFCFLSEKGSTLRLCSQVEQIFPFRVDPFSEGDWCARIQTWSHKSCLSCEDWQKI